MAQTNELNLGTNNASGLLNYTQPTDVKPLPALGNLSTSQTVQGQLGNITATNDQGVYTNPLMTRATTRANQAANKRGLLNTSMANQAGQEAVLSAALPIAQSDAKAYQTQALANQNAMNTFGTAVQSQDFKTALANQAYEQQSGTGIYGASNEGLSEEDTGNYVGGGGLISQGTEARRSLADQAYAQQVGTGDYSAETTPATDTEEAITPKVGGGGLISAKTEAEKDISGQAQEHQLTLSRMDGNQRTALLNLESQYNSILRSSQSTAVMWQQAMSNINDVQMQEALSTEQKNSLIASELQVMDMALGTVEQIDEVARTLGLNYSKLDDIYDVYGGSNYGSTESAQANTLP